MANRASLILIRHIMKRGSARRSKGFVERRMALQAQCVYIVASEQAWIWRTMRDMTKAAALGLDGRMLVDKWTGNFGVALHTDCISGDAAAQLLLFERSMWIVTVTAAYEPFVHLVMEGLRKSWLDVGMAAVTKFWLRNLEKIAFALKRMNAVATGATYPRFAMGRTLKIGMGSCVACKAPFIHHLRRRLAELENLGRISA